ncbi:MAG TPA: D-cysteine desulfhydrase family protein [Fimbriimonas sp.]
MAALPKVNLIQAPTPLHRLDGLSSDLKVDLWMKRDDLTGFAMGGNKGRKLEYLIADALEQNAEIVVTCGALQSNFIRQLGPACAMHGLDCAAVAMKLPFDRPAGQPEPAPMEAENGNALLSRLSGVDLRVIADGDWETLFEAMEDLAQELESQGRHVYRVPVGGSAVAGAYAFYEAGLELQRQQTRPFDYVVFASSSGSTQTGLAYAFDGTRTRIIGVCSDPEPEMVEDFATLGRGLSEILPGARVLQSSDFCLDTRFVGSGYGVPSEAGSTAIRTLLQREGILLDPIYTAKAFSGLLAMVEEGSVGGRVLFWHTGGLPALFAYPRNL